MTARGNLLMGEIVLESCGLVHGDSHRAGSVFPCGILAHASFQLHIDASPKVGENPGNPV